MFQTTAIRRSAFTSGSYSSPPKGPRCNRVTESSISIRSSFPVVPVAISLCWHRTLRLYFAQARRSCFLLSCATMAIDFCSVIETVLSLMGGSLFRQRKKITNPVEIIKRIEESEGERVSWKIEELHAIFSIFSENRKQLLSAIEEFERPSNILIVSLLLLGSASDTRC
jgi:hypothetical protein